MIQLTQSLSQWLFQFHPKLLPLIMFGHAELFTEEMEQEYLAWCLTDEGKSYLKGGKNYIEDGEQ